MSLKKNDDRVRMYTDARSILERAITFSPEERLAKAQAAKAALLVTKERQLEGALKCALTDGAAKRAVARVDELYLEEMLDIEEAINEAEQELATKETL